MGKCDIYEANAYLYDIADMLDIVVTSELCNVSNTIVFNVHEPLNIYRIAHLYNDCKSVSYEPELFHALSLHYWQNCFVNVFASGKVVVLGKNSIIYINDIIDWITDNICTT